MTIPKDISAGNSLDISILAPNYPAPDWQLTLFLRGPAAINAPAVATGQQHRITVSGEETAGWAAGFYRYVIRASKGFEQFDIAKGEVHIKPDFAQLTTLDARSHAQRVLEAIEAVIENRATMDQQSYTINNRSLSRTPLKDLLHLRSYYQDLLRRQRMGQGLLGRNVKVRF